jgi:RNA polymerase sigma-70 factor (ECF subfamily)
VDVLTRLARQAGAGDAAALEAFVAAAYDDVWRLCAALSDRQAADDLAQETFVQAVRALPGFEGRSLAKTWLLAIARNVCTDRSRALARADRRDSSLSRRRPTLAPDPAGALGLADLVRQLAPERRDAFALTQVLGLSYAETAEVCGCEVGTVRSRVARARADLVASLRRAEDERPSKAGPSAS